MKIARSGEGCLYDAVGLGQNSVDHVCLVHRYPPAGSKTDAVGYHMMPGGQIATAMLAAHRFGLRSCYLGAVGDDELGTAACRVLRQEGVGLRLKVIPGARTQFAMVTVDDSGERTIVEHYDPRTVLTADDLTPEVFSQTRALHLDITDVPAAIRAARWAREAGALVSLDIDRMLPGTEELLGLVDVLVASEGLPAVLGSPDPRLALFTLRRYCKGLVCITLGDRGCVVLDEGEALRVPAFRVKVVDTTGCGDVFRGVLLWGLLTDRPLASALRYASAAAALQAGALGAQAGVPRLGQVEEFLRGEPPLRD